METNHLLVEKYIPLANNLAYQKKRYLPSFIDVEDLKSAAYLGLVEAASRFNADLGVSFSTYAYPRISGAILDQLRELGWGKKTDPHQAVSLDVINEEHQCSRAEMIEAKEDCNCEELFEAITVDFDLHAKAVLRSYFIDENSMREVGEKFGVSEGRISQLIKGYKNKIRDYWSDEQLIDLAA